MAKFDVYRMQQGGGYLLDCQADLLRDLATRLVVPLLPFDGALMAMPRLNPVFEIEGSRYIMLTQSLASIPAFELQVKVASLGEYDLVVGNALDMLVTGF